MITERRPRIEDFEGLVGKVVRVRVDVEREELNWNLDQLIELEVPPLPQMEGMDCFTLLFVVDERSEQGLFLLEGDGGDVFQLMATPTIGDRGEMAMQVIVN